MVIWELALMEQALLFSPYTIIRARVRMNTKAMSSSKITLLATPTHLDT